MPVSKKARLANLHARIFACRRCLEAGHAITPGPVLRGVHTAKVMTIGQAPGVSGFYLANGFSGHGFQHAPVVGKLLAELIVDGAATSVDVSGLGLERFGSGELVREGHVV